jgi:hypothetical protein|tara:strand:- start:483 stop:656 length:174 start_codon:yes stop_codon:yes gene_type:complete
MSESDKVQANKFAVLLLQFDGEMFRTSNQLGRLIPEQSTLVRDRSGQIVGIPSVSGG